MATLRRYYDNFELESLEAQLISIRDMGEKKALILDETIFYPEGGGQSSDLGSINGLPIIDVQEEGDTVLHFVDTSSPLFSELKPGPVSLHINFTRRRDLATQHTAQHLLSATLLRLFAAPTLSVHLGDEISTVDVDSASLTSADLIAAEEAVFDIIEADYPVIAHLCPPEDIDSFPLRKEPPKGEEIIRVIEIDGYDYSPCCGTHLPSTGSIGILALTGAERYKGMTRISFLAGRRVLRELRSLHDNAEQVSTTLKVPLKETGAAAVRLSERLSAQERTLLNLRESLAAFEAARIAAQAVGKNIVECFADKSMDEAVRVGRALQKLSQTIIVIASGPDRKAAILCARSDIDLRPSIKPLMEAHGAKGGGSPSFFQLAFDSKAQLDAFLASARAKFLELKK
ncbi:alanyl-tRNA editing protein [Treponema sp.]